MALLDTRLDPAAEGAGSPRVARFLWQLENQRAGLLAAVAGITPAELEWQAAPGANTIGMLLAHLAYAEAHLGKVGLLGEKVGHARDVVGFAEEDFGIPLAPDAPPPPALAGRELAWFERALAAAREQTRGIAVGLTDADLGRVVSRPRADGGTRIFDVAWVLYHLVEHEAGHRAQIALLRHLHRAPAVRR